MLDTSLMRRVVCGVAVLVAVTPAESRAQLGMLGVSSANPAGPFSAKAAARRDSIVNRAKSQLGMKYELGATGGSAFDCSGFVRFVLGAFGVELPRTSTQQATVGRALPRDESALKPGDLLTFGRGKVSHVGIYVGEGKYVHASSYKHGVVESLLSRDAARGWWKGARRFVTDSSAPPAAPNTGTP